MKAVGLITEYNPLHNGHIYHIRQSKHITDADAVIAVMSGNFVQRGEPAVINKYSRARAAIEAGVNLVAELPSYYSISSAELFSTGALFTLTALYADSFVFGSECGDIHLLEQCADILLNEPPLYRSILKKSLSKGAAFPKARRAALSAICSDELVQCLDSPNNILGIEYIKALKKHKLSITPLTIKRIISGYHDQSLNNHTDESSDYIASATAIRNTLNDAFLYLPESMQKELINSLNITAPIVADDFSHMLNHKITDIMYQCNYNKHTFVQYMLRYTDFTEDLANRLFLIHSDCMTFSDYCSRLSNKQYTMTRISRCLMHILLEHTCKLKSVYDSNTPYIRILAMDKAGREYLNHIKGAVNIPIITKVADYRQLLNDDIHAASIYNQAVSHKFKTIPADEFRSKIYIKP